MKRSMIVSASVVCLLALAATAQADPPAGVGQAEVDHDVSCFVAYVDIGGESTPIFPGGEGLVFLTIDGQTVFSNDQNGNVLLRCHGRLPLGEDAIGFDFVTGEEILATLPFVDEACEIAEDVFPGACRGDGKVIVWDYEHTGSPCFIGGDATVFWHFMAVKSGTAHLTCHLHP